MPRPTHRTEILLLVLAVLGSIIIHAIYIVRGFGEPDAARLAVQAVSWAVSGEPITSYTLRVSFLYLLGLRTLVTSGVDLNSIPAIMNWANVVFGGLILFPMYFVWRRLSDARTAAIACAVLFFTPALWLASIYGMPHLPAFAFFMTALACYLVAIDRSGPAHRLYVAGATVCMVLAALLKADILLCSGAFAGVAFCKQRLSRLHTIEAGVIPLVALATTLLITRVAFPSLAEFGHESVAWSKQFPFTKDAFTSPNNLAVLLRTGGPVFLAAVGLSGGLLLFRGRYRLVIFALAWLTPAVLWWGLRMGNSARHMMAPFAVLSLILASGLVSLRTRRLPWLLPWALCVLLIVANLRSMPQTSPTRRPSTWVLEAGAQAQRRADWCHEVGRQFAQMSDRPHRTKLLGFGTMTRPFLQWGVFASGRKFRFVPGRTILDDWDTYLDNRDGGVDTLRTAYVYKPYYDVNVSEGWVLWTRQDKLRNFIRLRGIQAREKHYRAKKEPRRSTRR